MTTPTPETILLDASTRQALLRCVVCHRPFDFAAGDAAVHHAWLRDVWQAVRPFGSGVYVNFLEAGERDRIREAYPGDTYARLAAVKRQYDPHNVFRLNQNVPPAS